MSNDPVEIRILQKTDDRSVFSSGNINLDRFFQLYAGQNQFKHHIGTSYVAIVQSEIAGFATISTGEIAAEKIPTNLKKRLPNYPLPILRLSRLAVDKRFQKQGLGRQLLKTIFILALEMRQQYGCLGIVVDAKPNAVSFYETLGFISLELVSGQLEDKPEPIPMFLACSVLDKLGLKS